MTKIYGVWCECKEGLLNGYWDTISNPTKEYCEDMVHRWNLNHSKFKHEVRERPAKQ